jgi:hypothetical protein
MLCFHVLYQYQHLQQTTINEKLFISFWAIWLIFAVHSSSFYTFQFSAASRFFTLKSLPLWSWSLLYDIITLTFNSIKLVCICIFVNCRDMFDEMKQFFLLYNYDFSCYQFCIISNWMLCGNSACVIH